MRWSYTVPVVVLIVLLGVLGLGLTRDPTRVPSPLIGKPAPPFSLPTLSQPGHRITRQNLLGHVSVVNVWASWCASCRDEHSALLALANKNLVPLYGIDYKDTRAPAKRWLAQYGNPYHVVAFDQSGDVGINWGVYGVPETYVVDRRGRVRKKFIGPLSARIVDEQLIPLLHKLKRQG